MSSVQGVTICHIPCYRNNSRNHSVKSRAVTASIGQLGQHNPQIGLIPNKTNDQLGGKTEVVNINWLVFEELFVA